MAWPLRRSLTSAPISVLSWTPLQSHWPLNLPQPHWIHVYPRTFALLPLYRVLLSLKPLRPHLSGLKSKVTCQPAYLK